MPLLAAGEAEERPYFTMPYVSGESLRVRLAKERELPIGEAVRILREVASALAFAVRGASVVVCDLVDPADTAAEVERHGVKASSVQLDVADGAAVRDAVDSAVSTFGRLDFAHNNAGTFAVASLAACGGGDNDQTELDKTCSAEAHQASPDRVYIPSKICQAF